MEEKDQNERKDCSKCSVQEKDISFIMHGCNAMVEWRSDSDCSTFFHPPLMDNTESIDMFTIKMQENNELTNLAWFNIEQSKRIRSNLSSLY